MDVLKISDEETALLSGFFDPEEAAAAKEAQGIPLVLVILGANGVLYRFRGKTGRVPGFATKVADTNGTGDTFFGAVLSSLVGKGLEQLGEEDLREILKMANCAASITTSRPGAIPAMPTFQEVQDKLGQKKGTPVIFPGVLPGRNRPPLCCKGSRDTPSWEGVTMKEKWIFLDIDGTLTRPGSNVPPESALMAIRAAQAKGHKVLLCTGRNMALLSPLLQYGFDGVVASAGGYILYGGQVIYDCPMSQQQLELALETFHAGGVFCTIEAKDATYGDEALEDFLSQSPGDNSEIQRWRAALADRLGILPMEDYDGRPIYKVVFICREDSQLEKARAALEKEFLFCCQTMSSPARINGELINRKFDKGQGIRRLCRHLGVDLQDTFGFGDSMNDLEMMQTVGVGVAMANGNEEIKALADYVCPPVEEDGLAKAFARYQLV